MRTETTETKIYIAEDGTKFLSEIECRNHEEMFSDIEYFRVYYGVDQNETGNFTRNMYLAVKSKYPRPRDIAENYCIKQWGFLMPSVMGYGCQRSYSIRTSTREEFKNATNLQPRVFISRTKVDCYPEPFDYYKEWGFK